jgi:hypothetical protein
VNVETDHVEKPAKLFRLINEFTISNDCQMTVISGLYTYESQVYGSGCVFQYATTSTFLFYTLVLVNKHRELTSVAYEPKHFLYLLGNPILFYILLLNICCEMNTRPFICLAHCVVLGDDCCAVLDTAFLNSTGFSEPM